ncbi:hypothetical protein [Serratia sp. szju]|uniref:hypothetical protein n=1 Tax=Serratia sp. szju TaxID=3375638 RepID=UPI0037DC5AD3
MDKFSELKAVAEKAKELAGINNYKKGKDAIVAFKAAANPAAILAMLAELEFEKQNNAGVAGMVEDYETKLEAKDKHIAELEAEITNIVDSHAETVAELRANGRNEAIAECSVSIRQAGFLSEASPMTVAGDEQ